VTTGLLRNTVKEDISLEILFAVCKTRRRFFMGLDMEWAKSSRVKATRDWKLQGEAEGENARKMALRSVKA
jgi:hypothetical protein